MFIVYKVLVCFCLNVCFKSFIVVVAICLASDYLLVRFCLFVTFVICFVCCCLLLVVLYVVLCFVFVFVLLAVCGLIFVWLCICCIGDCSITWGWLIGNYVSWLIVLVARWLFNSVAFIVRFEWFFVATGLY